MSQCNWTGIFEQLVSKLWDKTFMLFTKTRETADEIFNVFPGIKVLMGEIKTTINS